MHTLGTAAKATGKSKGTIRKAIEMGRLSGSKNDKGEYEIDPAELHRVYPPISPQNERDSTHENTLQINLLQREIKRLDELLEQVKAERDRERQNHDTTKSTLEALKRLLPPPQPTATPQETQSAPAPKKGFFSRLFG